MLRDAAPPSSVCSPALPPSAAVAERFCNVNIPALHLPHDFQDQPEGVQQPVWLQAAGRAGHPERGALHPGRHQLRREGETGAHAGNA